MTVGHLALLLIIVSSMSAGFMSYYATAQIKRGLASALLAFFVHLICIIGLTVLIGAITFQTGWHSTREDAGHGAAAVALWLAPVAFWYWVFWKNRKAIRSGIDVSHP